MRVGAIAFYDWEHTFFATLTQMNLTKDSFLLNDDDFYSKYSVHKQAPLLMLLTHNQCWGYVAKKVNKRNGTTAWIVVNELDNFKQIQEDDIYFTLNLDDYTFQNWDELSSPHTLFRSKGNHLIRKNPSDTNRKNCVKGEFKVFKNSKLLHQVVECTNTHYGKKHPYNAQWDDNKFSPYYPTSSDFQKFYKNMTNPLPYNPKVKKTFHAIPFLRNNIKPTKLSVFIKPKEPVPTPKMFFNFPQGITMII
jgi:hypothetical protein